MSTRRKFLLDCSAAVAGLALVPVSPVAVATMAGGDLPTLEQLRYPVLAGQINTLFRIRLSERVVQLRLLKAPLARPTPVTPGRRPPGDAGNEKFSLIFSGPKDALLPSAIHQFEHRHLGRFEMYIGRIGSPEADSVRYEAVFNKPVAKEVTQF